MLGRVREWEERGCFRREDNFSASGNGINMKKGNVGALVLDCGQDILV